MTSSFVFSLFFIRYVRLLGAMYMRLTGTAVDCYKYLEPLYNDYRKIKTQNRNGGERLKSQHPLMFDVTACCIETLTTDVV